LKHVFLEVQDCSPVILQRSPERFGFTFMLYEISSLFSVECNFSTKIQD